MDPIPQEPVAPPIQPFPQGGAPTPTSGAAPMSQEDMKANLQAMMEKIQPKYQAFTQAKAAGDANVTRAQSLMLRQFFDVLSSYGIDPSNPEDVKQFLDKIKEANPQAYKQIEQSIGIMMGDNPNGSPSVDTGQVPQSPQPNMNMNQNATPQQTV